MRIYSGFLTSIGKVIKKKKIESKREDCEFLEEKIHSLHLAVSEGLFDATPEVKSWLKSLR